MSHAGHNAYQYAQTDNDGTPDGYMYCEAHNTVDWGTQSQSPSESYSTTQSGADARSHTGADTDARAHMEAEAFLHGLL